LSHYVYVGKHPGRDLLWISVDPSIVPQCPQRFLPVAHLSNSELGETIKIKYQRDSSKIKN